MTFVLAQWAEDLSFHLGSDSLGGVSNLRLVWGRSLELIIFEALCELWCSSKGVTSYHLPQRLHSNVIVSACYLVFWGWHLNVCRRALPSACGIASACGLIVMEFAEFLTRLSNSGGWSFRYTKCSLIPEFLCRVVSALILFCVFIY